MAARAAKAGINAIACVPPFFYEADDAAIVEHYRVVGATTDLPLLLYDLPSPQGSMSARPSPARFAIRCILPR